MTFPWLKRYVPRSLYLRATLILVLPVVVLQTVLSVVFVQRLFEDVTQQMTDNMAVELGYLKDLVEAAPDLETARDWLSATADELRIDWELPDQAPVQESRRVAYDLSGRLVIPTLDAALPGLGGVDLARDKDLVDLTVRTSKGALGLSFDRDRVSA